MTSQSTDLSQPAGQASISHHTGSGDLTRSDGSGSPAGHEPGLTFEQVQAAAARLAGVAHRTPLLTSATLDEQCGGPVMLKAENFQRCGAFKFRGAYNRLSMLSEQERAAGVVAFSSGNHGGAVALAAKLLGIPAVVVVPATGAPAKLAAIEGYGAEMVRYDPATERRAEVAAAIAAERSMTIIRPFDDYGVMAGQGTLGIELVEQAAARQAGGASAADGQASGASGADGQAGGGAVGGGAAGGDAAGGDAAGGDAASAGPVDQVLVPVGGGGLAAGVATAVRALLPGASVIGVEPAGANDTQQSFRAGHRVTLPEPVTIADGLLAQQPGELTFAVNSRLLDDVVTVSEEAIIDTMRFCFSRMKIVIEPSGAVALAALRTGAVPAAGHRSVAVISGGNIDPTTFAAYLAR